MKRNNFFIVCLSIICLLYTNQVYASREYAPATIPPVIYKDIKIVAENSSLDNMGVVQAFNINTNKLIWSKQVYTIKINPHIEKDTQMVFIKKMMIENDKLVIIDEYLKKYILDPNTGNDFNKRHKWLIIIIILISVTVIIYIVFKQYTKIKRRQ